MKEALKNYSTLESPHTRIAQCFLAIQENRVNEVDQLCKLAMNTLVNQWMSTLLTGHSSILRALPRPLSPYLSQILTLGLTLLHWLIPLFLALPRIPSVAHVSMLQSFQKIIELYESAKIVKDIRSIQRVALLADTRHALSTWRGRLPNEWDDIVHWHDLIYWRQFVNEVMSECYKAEQDKAVRNLGTIRSVS